MYPVCTRLFTCVFTYISETYTVPIISNLLTFKCTEVQLSDIFGAGWAGAMMCRIQDKDERGSVTHKGFHSI